LLQTKNVRIERIQYPKSNRKRCREELVFEYPNGVVIPFSQHVSGRETPVGAGERGHHREGKDARRQGVSAAARHPTFGIPVGGFDHFYGLLGVHGLFGRAAAPQLPTRSSEFPPED